MADSDAETPAGAPQPGTLLGSYRIERLLGRGGMGAVFLAFDTSLHRRVAVKLVEPVGQGDTVRARLLREARNAAALNHPNICTVHEVGDANGRAFIAMEYVEGGSLRDRLDEGALGLDEALGYGLQAAEALAFAHDHGVIHRDFKAANAIVTGSGRLKIVDFGLARRSEAQPTTETTQSSLVPAGGAAGTPYAMAPEQVRGELMDARTDIWAIGVLLYEMLGGAKPFEAPTLPDLFSSILRDAPAPLPATLPAGLRSVIARCLEKAPERRYQRAEEVRQALAECQGGSRATPATWRPQLARRWAVLSAAAFVAIAAALVALNVGGARDRLRGQVFGMAPIRLAVLPFENLTGDPAQEFFSDGLTEELITQLGRLQPQRLSVIARTSSMHYKNRDVPLDQIGRELQVDYVLEGSARREGSRVRINATLIQLSDQTQRWTESFERELSGILTLQNDVGRGVTRSLALTLLPAEQARLAKVRAVDPDAYEAYLKGLGHHAKLTRPDLDAAEKYYELALAKDPGYAPAHAGLAGVWGARQQMGFVPPSEAAPRMKAGVAQALALDDTLPEAHYQLAAQRAWTDWDWPGAQAEFERTLELAPSDAKARAVYSHYLFITRRPKEALEQIRQAVELDPLSELVRAFHGRALILAGRPSEALAPFREVLKTTPESPMALGGLVDAYSLLGREEEALAAEKARWAARHDDEIVAALSRGFAEGGYRSARRRAADALAARADSGYANALPLAVLYLRAGEIDRAFEWLEEAFQARNPNLPYLAAGPVWAVLRGDPRYAALLRQMNLPI